MRNKFQVLFLIGLSLLLLQCSGDKRLHRELVKMADNLNRSVPAQLDDHTLFLGAGVTEDNIFQYRYQLLNTADPQNDDARSGRANESQHPGGVQAEP